MKVELFDAYCKSVRVKGDVNLENTNFNLQMRGLTPPSLDGICF